jgi:hypothetical protein
MVIVPAFTLPLPSASFFFMCLVPGRGRVCREYSLPMSREGYLAPSDPSPPKSLSVFPLARDSSRGPGILLLRALVGLFSLLL